MSDQTSLESLEYEECVNQLRVGSVGRIAVIEHGFPVVLPVNYRLVETTGPPWVAIRTRPGNVLDQRSAPVAFEIDNIDPTYQRGWSVLVRGTLHHVNPDSADFRERFDPQPWLAQDRDAWLIIEPFAITGRRLHHAEVEWAFHPRAYV
jgi:nitroimidazol reductase NimA-like FMN-containing flavoprotein (pyridoxamine 5'-phosphate oxidase superfamily)